MENKIKRLSKSLSSNLKNLLNKNDDKEEKSGVNNLMLVETAQLLENASCAYEEELGHGKSAKVYKGIWTFTSNSRTDSKEVAIKQFSGDLSKVGTRLNSNNLEFLMELTTLRKMRHPHIVEYLSANNEKNSIILEYCANGTVQDLIQSGAFISWPDRISMSYQVIQAVKYIHSRQIIHADIRCGNVLVASRSPYHVKLFDFASSRSLHESPHVVEGNWNGEIRWQPPEVCKRRLDKTTLIEHPFQVDIYSLGVMLWEFTCSADETSANKHPLGTTLTNNISTLPFPEIKDNFLVPKAVVDGQRPNCDKIEAPASQYVDVMKRCWHHDPIKRPLILDLENIFELFDIHGMQFALQGKDILEHQNHL